MTATTRLKDHWMPENNYQKYYYYLCGRFGLTIDSYSFGDYTFAYDAMDKLYCYQFGKEVGSKVCRTQDKLAITGMRAYERAVQDESIEF